MITADQLVCHAVGDYILQSDWMANEKTKKSIAAFCHALTYGLPFLLLRPSLTAFAFIVGTHFLIDRWRLARFVCYAKNFIAPVNTLELVTVRNTSEAAGPDGFVHKYQLNQWWQPWTECSGTGYHKDRPPFLSVWLLIIADNTMHVILNGIAFMYL